MIGIANTAPSATNRIERPRRIARTRAASSGVTAGTMSHAIRVAPRIRRVVRECSTERRTRLGAELAAVYIDVVLDLDLHAVGGLDRRDLGAVKVAERVDGAPRPRISRVVAGPTLQVDRVGRPRRRRAARAEAAVHPRGELPPPIWVGVN